MQSAFYSQFLGHGDLAFDIGANVGKRTTVFLSLGARVVAVEPQPPCSELLRRRFGHNPHFTLVEKAVGSSEGEAEMLLCSTNTLSTLSRDWLARMQRSGRYGGAKWEQRAVVPVTTLDRLVAEFGMPAFCKIDTEGYEQEVLAGLSQPIPALSFEFAVETLDMAQGCVLHLSQLGDYAFNFSHGESMKWGLRHWVQPDALCDHLRSAMKGKDWGDVYARLAAGH